MSKPYTFEDGLCIGYILDRRRGRHPDKLIYTDADPDYIPPENADSDETFDTYTEVWLNGDLTELKRRVYGVGVKNKGSATESVTKLVYPDKSYISLVNF